MAARQRNISKAKRRAANPFSGARLGETSAAGPTISKLDKSGLYDLQQVKRVLDDHVIAYLEQRGYTESALASNVKIVAGLVAIVAAIYSHFNGREFPENRNLIIACVAIYVACVGIVSAMSYLWEGDSFFAAQLPNRNSGRSASESLAKRLWVQSTVGSKGESTFTLMMRLTVRRNAELTETLTRPYEEYFSEEGDLALSELYGDIGELLKKSSRLGKRKPQ